MMVSRGLGSQVKGFESRASRFRVWSSGHWADLGCDDSLRLGYKTC